MKTGFDLNRISGDGYLILPLSMSNLSSSQTPEKCYETLHHFTSKLTELANDVIFLYTTGLYLNALDAGYEKRVQLNQQAIQHARELRNLIDKRKEFISSAIYFLPIDYIILNSNFSELFTRLKNEVNTNEEFLSILKNDAGDHEWSKAEENFLIEEIVVSHLIRHQLVALPNTLVKNDKWRLISYPGKPPKSMAFVHKQNWLPDQKSSNPYVSGAYDYEAKTYVNFDD